ncbi:hypothetical protein KIW84_065718, partial [Lathyrus oleraceus]
MEESNAEWAELTRDCLTNILSRLSAKDQWLGAMLVCKSWFSAFKEPSLHSVFNLQPYFDLSRKSTLLSTRKFKSKIDSMLQPVVQSTHIFLTQICIQRCSDRSLDLVGQRYKLSSKFQYPLFLFVCFTKCRFGAFKVEIRSVMSFYKDRFLNLN